MVENSKQFLFVVVVVVFFLLIEFVAVPRVYVGIVCRVGFRGWSDGGTGRGSEGRGEIRKRRGTGSHRLAKGIPEGGEAR